MSLLLAIAELKELLSIPATLPLTQALAQMTQMMGLPEHDEHGHAISLPLQVERLQAMLGYDGEARAATSSATNETQHTGQEEAAPERNEHTCG